MALFSQRKRRLIPVIDARFQWKYTLLVTALGVSVTALLGGALYRQHISNTELLVLDAAMREQVMQGDQIFLLSLLLGILVLGVVLTTWGLVVTHRISGPLYLVANYLEDLAQGTYPDLRPLRKGDELQNFFSIFSSALNTMKQNDEALLEALQKAQAAVAKDPQSAQAELETIAQALAQRVGGDSGETAKEA